MTGDPGIRIQTPDSALIARARTLLSSGPAESTQLISYVCQIPGAPRAVAEHLATALLQNTSDFARDECGRWTLALQPRPAQARPRGQLRDLSYVVVDVETTGTRAFGGDRITEVAAVRVHNGEIVDVFETLVNPQRGIPRYVTALTRITWSMVRRAPPFREVAPRLSAALSGHLFTAHNAGFDWRFVAMELERAFEGRLLGERLCTVRLARAFLPRLRRRSLDALSHYFGVENTARHRAGGDAVATAHVLLRLLDEAHASGCRTLEDLRQATLVRTPRRRRRRRGLPYASDGAMGA